MSIKYMMMIGHIEFSPIKFIMFTNFPQYGIKISKSTIMSLAFLYQHRSLRLQSSDDDEDDDSPSELSSLLDDDTEDSSSLSSSEDFSSTIIVTPN